MGLAEPASPGSPHIPVLLRPLLEAVAPITGHWLDGTFGAGGYSRALLDAGADHVTGLDRDPSVADLTRPWRVAYGDRLTMIEAEFGALDSHVDEPLDGVVLDLGVSSMQIDQADRGFSFMKDGPLDMRMGATGPTAADFVRELSETDLADVLFHYGEERASRRIARAIVKARTVDAIETTGRLAATIETAMPRQKPGQSHPATRSFQALRIAVNDEYGQLAQGLAASERALRPGGKLAVVTFHSIEDRMVKRYFQDASSKGASANRYAPAEAEKAQRFKVLTRRAIAPDDAELAANPRSRSAKLRVAERTDAPAVAVDPATLGQPRLPNARGH